MGTSINSEIGGDKLHKSDSSIFYKAVEDCRIDFQYYDKKNPDYDCPYIPYKDLERLISSGKLKTDDGTLLDQIIDIKDRGEDLQLIH